MYEGKWAAPDSNGIERHFVLYWPKTEQLLGTTKAGPAVLLTECSLTRIDFSNQPQGIVFRGEPGRDRLSGSTSPLNGNPVCGKILNFSKLEEVPAGDIQLKVDCEPVSDAFAARPRTYIKASPEPYTVHVFEKTRHWSLFGETLPGPVLNCSDQPAP
jgi:hypothetical protein